MSQEASERERLARLEAIVRAAGRHGSVWHLDDAALLELPRLYRFASTVFTRLDTTGADPALHARVQTLLTRAHGLLYRDLDGGRSNALVRAARLLLRESPRVLRAEWKLCLAAFGLFYGLSALAFVLVDRDLSLAYALFDPAAVDHEIGILSALKQGESFRGNFDFGFGESPGHAGAIIANNLRVCALFFIAGILPPVYVLLLAANALMLGTYLGVAAHWGQAGAISSILWCHGTIELQTVGLAGTAGLVLLRAWLAPGPWTRSHAMRLESRRAWCMVAPVFPLLVIAGLIEGFVTPHADAGVRLGVALVSAIGLIAWLGWGGRRSGDPGTPDVEPGGQERRRRLRRGQVEDPHA